MNLAQSQEAAISALDAAAAMERRLREPVARGEVPALVDAALAACRELYGMARSREALPLAQAALAQSTLADDRVQARRSAMVCGLLAADSEDLVGAIEYHIQALRMATAEGSATEAARAWHNIGVTIANSGSYDMAARCYRRAIALLEPISEPLQIRYAASANLADCLFQLGELDEGLRFGEKALLEVTPELRDQDLHGAILLRRNMVRLLLAASRTAEAEFHVREAVALAERTSSPRSRIAADVTRASHELATGNADVALTRLEQALARAREVSATLRDVLACAVRAEDAAGNPARALLRLEELSNHIYGQAIERVRGHIALAAVREGPAPPLAGLDGQAKASLESRLGAPAAPENWKTLQRLAVSAALRMDPTGWHGMRVGALVKVLARALGMRPMQALELGLAAELHDIGMMSVPEGILSKRGRLNAAEHAIVARHTDAGDEMLRDDQHPRVLMAREIARYHHARWDGGGHPRVAGEAIPAGARMCAVADAYDIMVCGLGARPARTMAEALEELRREAGRQFDPDLVECFDGMIRSESEDLGVDLSASAGMEDFQELVLSLQEDRGFV